MKKKKAFTLLEIMIVIFLIGLIGSIVGYNMKGSLEEGKAFKTKQTIIKLKEVFELELARGVEFEELKNDPVKFLKASGIVKNPSKMIYDGWGVKFEIDQNADGSIRVISKKYSSWKGKKTQLRGRDLDD